MLPPLIAEAPRGPISPTLVLPSELEGSIPPLRGNFRQKFLAAQEFQIEGLVEHFPKSFGTFRKSIMDCGEGLRQLRGNDRNPEKIMSLCQWLLPSSPSKGPLGGTLWLPPHIQKGKWIAHWNFCQSLSTSNCC